MSGTAKQYNEELAVQRTRPADDQATENIGQSSAANRATCAKMSHQRMSGTTRSGLSQTGSCWCQTFSYRARAQFSNVAGKKEEKTNGKQCLDRRQQLNSLKGGLPRKLWNQASTTTAAARTKNIYIVIAQVLQTLWKTCECVLKLSSLMF